MRASSPSSVERPIARERPRGTETSESSDKNMSRRTVIARDVSSISTASRERPSDAGGNRFLEDLARGKRARDVALFLTVFLYRLKVRIIHTMRLV